MKILIVYDSLFGNTEKIAHAIKEGIGKKGIVVRKVKEVKPEHMKNIDLLIVGSPVHGGRPSQDTKKFLECISKASWKVHMRRHLIQGFRLKVRVHL